MRKALTLPEALLWRGLRGRGGEFVFRRQHPFGTYILDFYCPALRLAVEVDGSSHEFNAARDTRRDGWLLSQGVRTFRLPAVTVLADPDAAVQQVLGQARACSERHSPPLPR